MVLTASIQARPAARLVGDPAPRATVCLLSPHSGQIPAGVACHTVAQLNRELKKRAASLEQSREARDRAATALRRAESELRLVSAALMSTQEIERKRIADELHDSVGQAVGTVGFGVAVALDLVRAGNVRGAEEMLESISAQAKRTLGEVRRIAMDLRPATLDDLGIVGTLSWFFREFRTVHPQLDVVTDIDVLEREVPAALATAIYRVVQEACSNVVRHSGADEVRVALCRGASSILLRIEDNGRGLGATGPASQCPGRQGIGLRSMRDRVEFSGGSFRMESESGAGTCIAADWPLAGAYCRTPAPDSDGPADGQGAG